MTRAILRAAQDPAPAALKEQLDHALRLVGWSWIARECGVQFALIYVLIDAGAAPAGAPEAALVNSPRRGPAPRRARGPNDARDGALPRTLGGRRAARRIAWPGRSSSR